MAEMIVKMLPIDSQEKKAYGVDLDSEPLAYGKKNYLPQLRSEQQERIELMQGNVLSSSLKSVDITCAVNFSYYIFKERQTLLSVKGAKVRKELCESDHLREPVSGNM